ncbi:YicC/YloC family endoribonuclease [Hydrogenispora ethanolica]|jgi:uncharacterized protein (TIGR00255 family)|nr:YicC/YloC family endoribonuclease [Hydrogenispora ethanolica]
MTGYGRGTSATSNYTITMDIKSINHRYLEIYFKLPKPYAFLEDRLRREISNQISRGKIEVIVTIDKLATEENLVTVNPSLLASYLKAVQELKEHFGIEGNLDVQTVVNLPELFKVTQPELDQDILAQTAGQALGMALESLIESRKIEGERLNGDLLEKIGFLHSLRQQLLELSPQVVIGYQERLSKRITELTGGIEVDPSRLAMEVALFADKSDINEELVRIESHLGQFAAALKIQEPIGRRLDFLIQELNREINTVGSKANDLKIAQLVIEFKSQLEKIREQIQNIE